MTRRDIFCLIVTLLCLHETQGSATRVGCRAWANNPGFRKGDKITTVQTIQKNQCCGSEIGKFLAVKRNKLFHLECEGGIRSPTHAKVTLSDVGSHQCNFFAGKIQCDIESEDSRTDSPDNANAIASRLNGHSVPFDCESCNEQHYIEYLANGKVQNPRRLKEECPLFAEFGTNAHINKDPKFRLRGRRRHYDWPKSLASVQPVRLQLSQSAKSSWNISPFRMLSGNRKNASSCKRNTENYYRSPSYGGSGSGVNIPSVPRPKSSGSSSRGYRSHNNSDESAATRTKPIWKAIFGRK